MLTGAAQNPPSEQASESRGERTGVLIRCSDPIPYATGWALQQHIHAERLAGRCPDTLVVLEHLPVYTAGRRTKAGHFRPASASQAGCTVPIETVSRGGSVTYHGPGQLVLYPILALSHHAPGAKRYVHMLEEVLIRTLAHWDIIGHRIAKTPGVWTYDRQGTAKIASIGARIDRGVTLHGAALNVSNELQPFSRIVPCGIDGCRMTSMTEVADVPVTVASVSDQLVEAFSMVFGFRWANPTTGVIIPVETQPLAGKAGGA